MARKVAPALLTGCTIVVKPSSSPRHHFEFAKLAAKLDLRRRRAQHRLCAGATLGETWSKAP